MGDVSLSNPFRVAVNEGEEVEVPDGIRVTKLCFGESDYQKDGRYVEVHWEDLKNSLKSAEEDSGE